ncbi:MAG: cytochrome c [Epsilonproteobacteria bacterium]|nr:MAG: cytochrome c [Campylobacterota bacterium]
MIKIVIFLCVVLVQSNALQTGQEVFRTYCWGCHHETAVAFGPSFKFIANNRTQAQIKGYIIAPKSMFEHLGYKRSVMPSFKDVIDDKELELITNFIVKQKDK